MLKETVVALDGSGLAERAPTNGTALSDVTGRQMMVVCAGEPEQTVTAARARSRRVLVVDDEIAIRETIADVLQDAGYVVEQASHGSEGLAMLQRSRPDVVVLDLMMPIMDGWSFARACNARSDGRAVPIVIVSAGSDLERSAKQLRPHGVRAALPKPFDVEVLLAAVGRLAAGR